MLKLGNGRGQVTQGKKRFAQREGRFGDAGRQRCRLAQDLHGFLRIARCKQRAAEGNSGKQSATTRLELRLQKLHGAAGVARCDPRVCLGYRIGKLLVVRVGLHLTA